MKPTDTVTIHHLVTTTIPLTLEQEGEPGTETLRLRTGASSTTVRRLSEFEARSVIDFDVKVPEPSARWAEALVGPLPSAPDASLIDAAVDQPGPVTEPDTKPLIDQATETPDTPTPTPAAPEPKPRNAARRGSPESAAINEQIRTALAAGNTIATIANDLGMTDSAVRQRINRYNLDSAIHATPPPSKRRLSLAPKRPAPATPKKTLLPNPKPGTARSRMVPALGAQRRIRSLYAIGYDNRRLSTYLAQTDVVVTSIVADDVTEIPRSHHDAIDALWRRLRYSSVTPSPSAGVPRGFPPPGKWDNIDDPNEHHGDAS